MPRRYETVWSAIKKADPDTWVRFTVSARHVPTFIQAVYKEKARQNVQRKQLGLPTFGRLKVQKGIYQDGPKAGKAWVDLMITYNGDMI